MKVYKPNFAKRGGKVIAVFQSAENKQVVGIEHISETQWKALLASSDSSARSWKLSSMAIDCDGDALVCVVKNALRWLVVLQAKSSLTPAFFVDEHVSAKPLVPVIAQNHETGEILMVAYTDQEGWQQTIETGFGSYYSTSRNKSWVKGEESGNKQKILWLGITFDRRWLLYGVAPLGNGVACHTNARTCFYRSILVGGDSLPAPDAGPKESLEVVDIYVHPSLSPSIL